MSANAIATGVAKGPAGRFDATSRGIVDWLFVNTVQTTGIDNSTRLQLPVVTAPRGDVARELLGWKMLKRKFNMNLDDRQPEQGHSKIWRGGTIDNPDQSTPIRWDAMNGELMLDYYPLDEVGSVDRTLLLNAITFDRQQAMGCESVNAFYTTRQDTIAIHAMSAEMLFSYSADESGVDEIVTTAGLDKLKAKVASNPNRYTIDIIKGRSPDEREIRGAKRQMPKSKLRNLSAAEFARQKQRLDVIFVDVEDVVVSIQSVFDTPESVHFWVGSVAYHAGVLVFLDSDVASES